MIRGLPEVPMGIKDAELRRHLIDMRECVKTLMGTLAPPAVPSNAKVTAQPLGNLVQWTRGISSDYHELLISSTPSTANAQVLDVGDSASYFHNVGDSGVKYFYWIRARKFTGARSLNVLAGSGTTLSSTSTVTPPTPPPSSQIQAKNQQTGHIEPITQPGRVETA
jgi:hypothetical protein